MRKSIFGIVLFSLFLLFDFHAKAQTQSDDVEIRGLVTNRVRLSIKYADTGRISVKAKGHDGVVHEFSGYSLFSLLQKAGAIPRGGLRGKSMTRYIVVRAADRYQVVFAIPEFDPAFTDHVIILADMQDGRIFDIQHGPFQLIVPGDKKAARWVRQVRDIEVKDAADGH